MAAYVEGEAEISVEDYRLLETMNLAAAERYSGMAESSAGLVAFAERLQSKCDAMLPQLAAVRIQSVGLGGSGKKSSLKVDKSKERILEILESL